MGICTTHDKGESSRVLRSNAHIHGILNLFNNVVGINLICPQNTIFILQILFLWILFHPMYFWHMVLNVLREMTSACC